jgi:mannosyltransferase
MNVDLTVPTRPAPPAAGPVGSVARHRLAVAAVLVAVLAGVVLRFAASSDLWLDEALTVDIARLPLDRLRPALLHDGAPPLYYVVLHFWMRVFGTSTTAVRSLSGVLGVLAIALGYLAGRSWASAPARGRLVGSMVAVVVATSPFAIHYATEVRMYGLTIVLGLLGLVLAAGAWRAPTPARLVGITIVTAGLLYTQYWAFFLVGVVGVGLLAGAVFGTDAVARPARRLLGAVIVGVLLFAPWWPTFTSQLAHTGTPWDTPITMLAGLGKAWLGFGGTGWWRWVVSGALTVFVLIAGLRARGGERTVAVLAAAVGVATLLVGIVGSVVGDTGFQDRYAAVAFPFLALAVAFGGAWLPAPWVRAGLVTLLAVVGLAAGAVLVRADRTASTAVARALRAQLGTGDVVAYCPDQLGPSTARLLPAGTAQVTFPVLASPELVDWTDYADRNAAGSPSRFADSVVARAGAGRVFLVWSGGYRTLAKKCEETVNAFTADRPDVTRVTVADGPNGEQVAVTRFDP